VFEGDYPDGSSPEKQAIRSLSPRLSEALSIPIKDAWATMLWENGLAKDLLGELQASGDCLVSHWVNVSERAWSDKISFLVKENKIII